MLAVCVTPPPFARGARTGRTRRQRVPHTSSRLHLQRSTAMSASASGKVLVCGGYVVLDRQHRGYVVSLASRMDVSIGPLPQTDNDATLVVLHSPQYCSTPVVWQLEAMLHESMPRLVSQSHSNVFVERSVEFGLAALSRLLGLAAFRSRLGAGLQIDCKAHAHFYSTNTNPDGTITSKTGLGSSAALCSSLVGALFSYFKAYTFTLDDANVECKEVAHRVAQLAHCAAQGKVGSGFDISSAFFGSHIYRRFSKGLVSDIIELAQHNALKSTLLMERLVSPQWDHEVEPLCLPPGIEIILADVSGGSETPSMVRKVLEWRASSEESERIWTRLAALNEEFFKHMGRLHSMAAQDRTSYEATMAQCGSLCYDEWGQAPLAAVLRATRVLFNEIRELLRQIGAGADVPIEPTSQSELIEASLAVAGVLVAGVPGAGGYDAVFALCIGPHSRRELQTLWETWPRAAVKALDVVEDTRGLLMNDSSAL